MAAARGRYFSPRHDSHGDIIGWTGEGDRPPPSVGRGGKRTYVSPPAHKESPGPAEFRPQRKQVFVAATAARGRGSQTALKSPPSSSSSSSYFPPSPGSPPGANRTVSPVATFYEVAPADEADEFFPPSSSLSFQDSNSPRTPSLPPLSAKARKAPPIANPDDRPLPRPAPSDKGRSGTSRSLLLSPGGVTPLGLSMDLFMADSRNPFGQSVAASSSGPVDEIELMDIILQSRKTMSAILNSRLNKIRVAKAHVTDPLRVVDYLVGAGDPAVMVDVLSVVGKKETFFTLDVSVNLLSTLASLLASPYEHYIVTALRALCTLSGKHVGDAVYSLTSPPSPGVDLARESRLIQYGMLRDGLLEVEASVLQLSTMAGVTGQLSAALLRHIDGLKESL